MRETFNTFYHTIGIQPIDFININAVLRIYLLVFFLYSACLYMYFLILLSAICIAVISTTIQIKKDVFKRTPSQLIEIQFITLESRFHRYALMRI